MSEKQLDALRAIARDVHSGKCVECKWFRGAEKFQRFGWFGLRKDIETSASIRHGQCAAHFGYAGISRECKCRGKDWEPKP